MIGASIGRCISMGTDEALGSRRFARRGYPTDERSSLLQVPTSVVGPFLLVRMSCPAAGCPASGVSSRGGGSRAGLRTPLQLPVARECGEPPKREPRRLGGSKRRGREALRPGGHSQFKGPLIITSVAFGRSIEYERIICEVLGRHLVRRGHHFKWIKRRRRGDTGLAGGHRGPSCDERHHQSGGADCEQCLGHLSSPCPLPNLCT